MARAARKSNGTPVAFQKPVADLVQLGEKLQQSIELTRQRVANIRNPRLKFNAMRTIDRASYLFRVMGQTVQTTNQVVSFLDAGFNLNVKSILALAGKYQEPLHGAVYSGMLLVNEGIHRVLLELSEINNSIDAEVCNGKQN